MQKTINSKQKIKSEEDSNKDRKTANQFRCFFFFEKIKKEIEN